MFRHSFFLLAVWLSTGLFVLGESLTGKITDPSRSTVPGVRLMLYQNGRAVASTVSGRDGKYLFDSIRPGDYYLCLSRLGFNREERPVRLESGRIQQEDVTLSLESIQEKVVVTATRTDSSPSLSGYSISIIAPEEIGRRQASSVTELLRHLPGMNLVQTGSRGGVASTFLRGAPSNYTKVLLDGIPLNQPGGDMDLSNLSTAEIERVEVVRGPQSALYGTDAIGGVIQLFTRHPEDADSRPSLDFQLEGGTRHAGTAGASVRGLYRRLQYSFGLQQGSTRNQGPNDFYRNQVMSSRIGLTLSAHSTLDLVGRVERGRHGVAGPIAFGPADLDAYSLRKDHDLGAAWNYESSPFWHQKVSYSQSFIHQLSDNPADSGCFTPSFAGHSAPYPYCDYPYSFLNSTRRQSASYQSDFRWDRQTLTAGMDWEEQRGRVGETDARRRNRGYYLQDQILLLPRLAVTAGVRLEDNQSYGLAAVPRMSAAYLVRKDSSGGFWGSSRAKFNFGLGIKEPSFIESFSTNFWYKGNPDLRPEKTRSFEVGWEQSLAGRRLQIETNLFFNRFRDQIALLTTDWVTYSGSFFNIGRSRAWGAETSVKAQVARDLRLSGSYTYLNTRVTESASPFNPLLSVGSPLLRRPGHSGFLAATWDRRRWTLQTDLYLVGSRRDGDFYGLGLTTLPFYSRWDAIVSFRPAREVDLYAVAENLLNRNYFEVQGYPSPGFQVRCGIRYRPRW